MNPLLMQSIIEDHHRALTQATYPRAHRPRPSRRRQLVAKLAASAFAVWIVVSWIA